MTCKTGWRPFPDGQCCSPNSKWDSTNGCSCITGTTWNGQTCAGKTPTDCPSGTSPTSDGNCVCIVGSRASGAGECKPYIPAEATPYDIGSMLQAFAAIGQAPFGGFTKTYAYVLGNVVDQGVCVWEKGYTIRNINSNGSLNIKDDYPYDFGDIIQWDCNSEGASSNWRFEKVGSGPFFKILSCLSPMFTGATCLSTGCGAGYTNVWLRSQDRSKCGDGNVDAQTHNFCFFQQEVICSFCIVREPVNFFAMIVTVILERNHAILMTQASGFLSTAGKLKAM